MTTNVGNVRIEQARQGCIRLSQNTLHPTVLDCLLHPAEARALAAQLLQMAPLETLPTDDDELLV